MPRFSGWLTLLSAVNLSCIISAKIIKPDINRLKNYWQINVSVGAYRYPVLRTEVEQMELWLTPIKLGVFTKIIFITQRFIWYTNIVFGEVLHNK